MVDLILEPYCEKCNEFEAHVTEYETFESDTEFHVTCKHANKCNAIYDYIRNQGAE